MWGIFKKIKRSSHSKEIEEERIRTEKRRKLGILSLKNSNKWNRVPTDLLAQICSRFNSQEHASFAQVSVEFNRAASRSSSWATCLSIVTRPGWIKLYDSDKRMSLSVSNMTLIQKHFKHVQPTCLDMQLSIQPDIAGICDGLFQSENGLLWNRLIKLKAVNLSPKHVFFQSLLQKELEPLQELTLFDSQSFNQEWIPIFQHTRPRVLSLQPVPLGQHKLYSIKCNDKLFSCISQLKRLQTLTINFLHVSNWDLLPEMKQLQHFHFASLHEINIHLPSTLLSLTWFQKKAPVFSQCPHVTRIELTNVHFEKAPTDLSELKQLQELVLGEDCTFNFDSRWNLPINLTHLEIQGTPTMIQKCLLESTRIPNLSKLVITDIQVYQLSLLQTFSGWRSLESLEIYSLTFNQRLPEVFILQQCVKLEKFVLNTSLGSAKASSWIIKTFIQPLPFSLKQLEFIIQNDISHEPFALVMYRKMFHNALLRKSLPHLHTLHWSVLDGKDKPKTTELALHFPKLKKISTQ